MDEALALLLDAIKNQNTNSDNPSSDHEQLYETISEGKKKKFICSFPDCQKVFRFKSEIDRHISVHSETKPHACTFEKCKKSFKRLDALENHIRSQHTGEAVLACQYPGCGLHFTTSSKLRYHTILHIGEKRYKCTIPGCDRAFVTLSQLKQHERSAIAHKRLGNGLGEEQSVEQMKMEKQGEVKVTCENVESKQNDNVRLGENRQFPVKKVKVDTKPVQEQLTSAKSEISDDNKEVLLKRVFLENEALKERLYSTKKLLTEMKGKLDQIGTFTGEGRTFNMYPFGPSFMIPGEGMVKNSMWMNEIDWNLFEDDAFEMRFGGGEQKGASDGAVHKGQDMEDLLMSFNFDDMHYLSMK